jgi:hypothetical protein
LAWLKKACEPDIIVNEISACGVSIEHLSPTISVGINQNEGQEMQSHLSCLSCEDYYVR